MNLKQITLAALVATSSLAGTVQAASINGTGSVSLLGVSAVPPGLINVGTTFNFAASLWSSGTTDLLPVPFLNPLTTSSIVATVGSPVSFTSSFGNFSGTVSLAGFSSTPINRVVSVYALGTFTPLGLLSSYDPGEMSLTFSATQTLSATSGPNASISASYTIASPPSRPPEVPEPGALALVGIAMAGLALTRRRKA